MNPTDYQKLCREIFGTDDEAQIRRLAAAWNTKNSRNAGRKKAFSEEKIAQMRTMRDGGAKIQQIADHFGITRQSVSRYLNGRPAGNFTMRIDYRHGKRICTVIYADFLAQKILVENRTDDMLYRAFGVIEQPTWQDFEQFLLSRCFPQSRGYAGDILRHLGLTSYDPLQIVEATGGRTAEDNMCLTFQNYPREVAAHAQN